MEWYCSVVSVIFQTCRIPVATEHAQTVGTRFLSPRPHKSPRNKATILLAWVLGRVTCPRCCTFTLQANHITSRDITLGSDCNYCTKFKCTRWFIILCVHVWVMEEGCLGGRIRVVICNLRTYCTCTLYSVCVSSQMNTIGEQQLKPMQLRRAQRTQSQSSCWHRSSWIWPRETSSVPLRTGTCYIRDIIVLFCKIIVLCRNY